VPLPAIVDARRDIHGGGELEAREQESNHALIVSALGIIM
jgi:metal-dependent amidase/aminoacylase/carboxypeptidase family protein